MSARRRLSWLCAAVVATTMLVARPSMAALAPDQVAAIGARPAPGARLPLDAPLIDLDGRGTTLAATIGGRPAVLVFTDYACTQLCSPILGVTARALGDSGLTPGADYRLVVIGFNPRATTADAHRMIDGEVGGAPLRRATAALTASEAVVARLTAAAGYTYVYDRGLGRYAHPAALYVVTGDGRIARVLSGLAITGPDARLALVEAGNGAVGALGDQIRLLCYGFSANVGYYADAVRMMLATGGAATLLALVGGAIAAARMKRRGA